MEKKYSVKTLLDIARIPEDAFPRFMEEFSKLVSIVRDADQAQTSIINQYPEEVRAELQEKVDRELIGAFYWEDDGEQHARVKIHSDTPEGKLEVNIDSRLRDMTATLDGEDKTYDLMIIGKLAEGGLSMTGDYMDEMLPEGKLVLTGLQIASLRDANPNEIAELCIAANRVLHIEEQFSPIPEEWTASAQSTQQA